MSDKSLKDSPKLPKSPTDDIEDWDDFEEVDLSKKRYVSDDVRDKLSISTKQRWEDGVFDNQRLNNEILIERFRQIHGDKYDYSKVDYDYSKREKPLVIVCPIHGEFRQPFKTHLKGKGCQRCALEQTRETKKQKLISQFKDVHGDRYDYSKVVYVNTKTSIEIICPKHGSFFQKPLAHKRGQTCGYCSKRIRFTKEEIIQKSKEVHGDRYDYSKVDYQGSKQKIVIICKTHGEFLQSPSNHYRGGNCPECMRLKPRNFKVIDLDELRKLRESGLSVAKLSKHFDVSRGVIARRLRLIR